MDGLEDLYALSICTYVLNLAKHPYETNAFYALESKASMEGDIKWWSKPIAKYDKNPWHSLPRSVDVEMTSYALLTYLRRNLFAESMPIMKWLVKQRNSEGGFASTQVNLYIYIYMLFVTRKRERSVCNAKISFNFRTL